MKYILGILFFVSSIQAQMVVPQSSDSDTGKFLQTNGAQAQWNALSSPFFFLDLVTPQPQAVVNIWQPPNNSFGLYIGKSDYVKPLIETQNNEINFFADVVLNDSVATKSYVWNQTDGAQRMFVTPSLTSVYRDTLPPSSGVVILQNNLVAGTNVTISRSGYTFTIAAASGTGNDATIFTSTANGTVANTTTETSIIGTGVGSATLGANTLAAGTTITVKSFGYFSTTLVPTYTIKVKLGSTVIGTTGAISASGASNSYWEMKYVLTCRTTGSSGTVIGQGKAYDGADILEAPMASSSTTTINTTVSQLVDVTWTWSAANASNTATSTNVIISTSKP